MRLSWRRNKEQGETPAQGLLKLEERIAYMENQKNELQEAVESFQSQLRIFKMELADA